MADKRIIELEEVTNLSSSDYLMIDHLADGVRKIKGNNVKGERFDGLTAETEPTSDDYVMINNSSDGTRKILASDIGGENFDKLSAVYEPKDTDYLMIHNSTDGTRKILANYIDGSNSLIFSGYPEKIPLTPGDETINRTFVFTRKPERVVFSYISEDDGWRAVSILEYGDDKLTGIASARETNGTATVMFEKVSYSEDGLSFTITGHNSFGAVNLSNITGYMYVYYGSGGSSPIIYSLEEREVGVWTDGKPIYQKTYTFSSPINLPTQTWTDLTDVPNTGMEKIIQAEMRADSAVYGFVGATCDTGDYVRVLQTRNTALYCTNITLWYTKTTDVAGSGKYTTIGTPTVHYDDTERIVGTWFGETVYQKTFETNLNTRGGAWIDTGCTIENLDKLIDFEMEGIDTYVNGRANIKMCYFRYYNSNIQTYINGEWQLNITSVTVRYTKTAS